jgi:quinol-cytochrome oxidoreductase complex cytochrome b subunit
MICDRIFGVMVLPWGSNEFLGVTCNTNLLSIVPIYGEEIVTFYLGRSFSWSTYFNRFFLLHIYLAILVL